MIGSLKIKMMTFAEGQQQLRLDATAEASWFEAQCGSNVEGVRGGGCQDTVGALLRDA